MGVNTAMNADDGIGIGVRPHIRVDRPLSAQRRCAK